MHVKLSRMLGTSLKMQLERRSSPILGVVKLVRDLRENMSIMSLNTNVIPRHPIKRTRVPSTLKDTRKESTHGEEHSRARSGSQQ